MRRRPWYRDPAALTVDTLAAARLTRLVTEDTWPPAVAARRAAIDWLDRNAPDYAHGLTCPWCASPWIAALLVAAHQAADRHGRNRVWVLALLPLAISHAAGLLAELEAT